MSFVCANLLVLSLGANAWPTKPVVPIPRACEPPHDKLPFCNPSLQGGMPARVDDLISRLTLDEKPYLLVARESPLGNISRLGIPEYDWGGNCIHGVQSRCGYGDDGKERCPTSFPDPNFLGASFNKSSWLNMGKVIGVELRSLWLQGIGENHAPTQLPHIGLDCWSPNVGINRDPRWGRNMEVPSEDPLLNGYFGEMYSVGMQKGEDSRFLQGIGTLKHFDANSLEGNWPGPESMCPGGVCTRHTIDVNISRYDLASSYLPAFKRSVVEGDIQAVMCSYNSINGVPSCANKWLLGDVLRKGWDFKGMVTGDSGAVRDIYASHKYAPTMNKAVIDAISAGTDVQSAGWKQNQPWATGGAYIDDLPGAVRAGLLNESVIDLALKHTMGLRFRLGLFDPIEDQPYWHVPKDVVASDAHIKLAHEASEQGMVLLKNEGKTLPFNKAKTTATIGPLSDQRGTLIGNYMGQICPDDGDGVENYNCVQSFYEGVGNASTAKTTHSEGVPTVLSNSSAGFADALATAEAADQVLLFLGIDGTVEGEGKDRHFIGLPDGQMALAKAVISACAATNKPVAVVLVNGGQLAIDWLAVHAPAVVEAWYPGIYGARSVARAVYGESNRWGKSPVTIYGEGVLDEFNMLDFEMGGKAKVGRSYRYYTGKHLLYPMGHGLSYTTFAITESKSDGTTNAADTGDKSAAVKGGEPRILQSWGELASAVALLPTSPTKAASFVLGSGFTMAGYNGANGTVITIPKGCVVRITSEGHTVLDAGGKGSLFIVEGSLTAEGLSLKNGVARGTGGNNGGAFRTDGSATFTRCSFINNSAPDGDGGVAHVYAHASATFTNCSFAQNSAHAGGGAVDVYLGTARFVNCSFEVDSRGAALKYNGIYDGGKVSFGCPAGTTGADVLLKGNGTNRCCDKKTTQLPPAQKIASCH